jgi:hypothetical protein
MTKSLLLAYALLLPQQPHGEQKAASVDAQAATGIIAGTVVGSAQQPERIQVILLSAEYLDLWNGDVQRRLDVYWERYKPAFAKEKELFFQISRMAHIEATDYVLGRMRRDMSASDYLKHASPEGRFEFKNVPYGEYKILALGRMGEQQTIWQESVDVRSPIPQFLELKKPLP